MDLRRALIRLDHLEQRIDKLRRVFEDTGLDPAAPWADETADALEKINRGLAQLTYRIAKDHHDRMNQQFPVEPHYSVVTDGKRVDGAAPCVAKVSNRATASL